MTPFPQHLDQEVELKAKSSHMQLPSFNFYILGSFGFCLGWGIFFCEHPFGLCLLEGAVLWRTSICPLWPLHTNSRVGSCTSHV